MLTVMKQTFLAAAGVAVFLFLGGCCIPRCHQVVMMSVEEPYWQVVTTDVEGCWIAQWIAEGEVKKAGNGYCFRAMQRRIFRPFTLTFKYPLGRLVKVEAPNIIVTPTEKPQWLRELDRYTPPPDQCRVARYGLWRK